VLCNSKYRDFWPGLSEIIHPGVPFLALVHHAQALGLFDDQDDSLKTAMQRRMDNHRRPKELFVVKLSDGRWLQISERRTADGGSVAIYTDITEIKLSEQRQRERELAEKHALLQATFDTISQGISVVDADFRLVTWNERFLELLSVTPDEIAVNTPLRALVHLPAIRCQFLHAGFASGLGEMAPFTIEQACDNGRVLEIQMRPMPEGGMVTTYADITERKAAEWALRDSEQRIRLITDNIPALIAYVDAGQRYRFTNKPYEVWFNRPRSEINGRQMKAVLGPELYEPRRRYVEEALAGHRVTFEYALPRGAKLDYALATYVPHFSGEGEVVGFFALIQNITERKQAAEQLREAKESLEIRVAERTYELTGLNHQLKLEVDERRLAEAALRLAKAEAEQANMSKTKFLAAASHDLLQPLNAARVFTETLRESRMAERNRGLVDNVNTALTSVEELLTALLDISKLDAGAHTPEIADLPIKGLLKALAAEYQPQAKGRRLSLKTVPSTAVVRTDPVMVGRILRNFISNAMRYTPQGRILIGCRRRAEGLEVQVWDTGIGIAEDKLAEVFDEFRRLAVDSHGQDQGMGLGLAIVDRIARRLGHPITVRSRPGRGSMFGILLPLGNALKITPQDPGLALPPSVDRVTGTTVLIIENDAPALAGMQALLTTWQCKTLAAASAEAAIALLRQTGVRPEVMLADYHLDDDKTGLEALQALQAELGAAVPGVILTADRSDEILNAVRGRGFHLLNKPLKPARLRSLLAHLSPKG